MKQLSENEKEQILAFKNQGWANLKIAKHLGRHSSSINNFLKRNANPTTKRKPGPKEKLNTRQEY